MAPALLALPYAEKPIGMDEEIKIISGRVPEQLNNITIHIGSLVRIKAQLPNDTLPNLSIQFLNTGMIHRSPFTITIKEKNKEHSIFVVTDRTYDRYGTKFNNTSFDLRALVTERELILFDGPALLYKLTLQDMWYTWNRTAAMLRANLHVKLTGDMIVTLERFTWSGHNGPYPHPTYFGNLTSAGLQSG